MPPTRLTSVLVPALLVVLFAACGGDDDSEREDSEELTELLVDWGDGNR